jgi:hypothetical protein
MAKNRGNFSLIISWKMKKFRRTEITKKTSLVSIEKSTVKLRLHATINRVRFVFWRIKISAGAIIHWSFVKKKFQMHLDMLNSCSHLYDFANGQTRLMGDENSQAIFCMRVSYQLSSKFEPVQSLWELIRVSDQTRERVALSSTLIDSHRCLTGAFNRKGSSRTYI